MKNKVIVLIGLLIVLAVVFLVGLRVRSKQSPTYQLAPLTSPSPTSPTGRSASTNEIPLVVSSPVKGATVTSASLTVGGKTAPRAEVFVNDVETKADASGNFSVRLTLDEGENPIVVIVNDAGGKTAEQELTVTYTPNQ